MNSALLQRSTALNTSGWFYPYASHSKTAFKIFHSSEKDCGKTLHWNQLVSFFTFGFHYKYTINSVRKNNNNKYNFFFIKKHILLFQQKKCQECNFHFPSEENEKKNVKSVKKMLTNLINLIKLMNGCVRSLNKSTFTSF